MKLLSTIGDEEVTLELPGGAASQVSFLVGGEPDEAQVQRLSSRAYSVIMNGKSYDVRVHANADGVLDVAVNGVTHHVTVRDPRRWSPGDAAAGATGPQQIKALMPGKVVKLLLSEGEAVEVGQGVVVVEAMKMQNEMKSPRAGTVTTIHVAEGGSVAAGDALVVIE